MVTYGIPSNPTGAHRTRMKSAYSLIGFPKGDLLLDVPCGVGHFYPYVKDKYNYIGLDSSPEMLAIARKHFPEGDFRLGDIYELEKFPKPNILVCLSLFIHLPNPFKILKKINEHFLEKAIIGLQISRRARVRKIPRGDKVLIVRTERMKIVKGWLRDLKIENYIIEPIEGNTYYLLLEK